VAASGDLPRAITTKLTKNTKDKVEEGFEAPADLAGPASPGRDL